MSRPELWRRRKCSGGSGKRGGRPGRFPGFITHADGPIAKAAGGGGGAEWDPRPSFLRTCPPSCIANLLSAPPRELFLSAAAKNRCADGLKEASSGVLQEEERGIDRGIDVGFSTRGVKGQELAAAAAAALCPACSMQGPSFPFGSFRPLSLEPLKKGRAGIYFHKQCKPLVCCHQQWLRKALFVQRARRHDQPLHPAAVASYPPANNLSRLAIKLPR